jgi:hypothetical protein
MPKYEITKSIEARKLNKRSGLPTTDPPVTIPFAAIIDDVESDRDLDRFNWLGQPYSCPHSVLASAIRLLKASEPHSAPAAVEQKATPPPIQVHWEELRSSHHPVMRAKVPGGWLVTVGRGDSGVTFYPDPDHAWDGRSLP